MLYSKIKSIIQKNGKSYVRQLYTALLTIAENKQEIASCLEEIETYIQLIGAYGDPIKQREAAQLLYTVVIDCENDYKVGNWRIIHRNQVDEVLTNELENNPEFVGSMNKYYLAEALDIPYEIIALAQSTQEYYKIGACLTIEQIANIAEVYHTNDGYGAWFGPETEISFGGKFTHYLFNERS